MSGNVLGCQVICDCFGCNDQIKSAKAVREALLEAADRSGVTLLELIVHEFHPQGISAIALIAESHIFLHTWPEKNYLALDAFTCGDSASPQQAVEVVRERFVPTSIKVEDFSRGHESDGSNSPGEIFSEVQIPGVEWSVEARRHLLSRQTDYQKLDVYETKEFGKLMALDDKVMLTERDEAFYHEMLVHPALLTHPCPKRIMVIGGGDGGAIREVLQHPSVEEVIWVEIDKEVVSVSQKYFPEISQNAMSDPRVTLHVEAGESVLSQITNPIDVIIVDSTDPCGPAVPLFERSFFQLCDKKMSDEGIFVTQSGTPFYFSEEVRLTHQKLTKIFSSVRMHLGFVPTYPSGLWTFTMASHSRLNIDQDEVVARYEERQLICRYYCPDMHLGSSLLPAFVRELISESIR